MLRRKPGEIDWQEALYIPLTILAWLAVIIIAAWLLSHIVKTLLTIMLSGIIAFALTPLVHLLHRRLPTGISIFLAYVVGFSLILGLGSVIVITAAAQITSLVHDVPSYSTQFHNLEPQLLRVLQPFGVTAAKLQKTQTQLVAYVQGAGTSVARSSVDIIAATVGTIVDVILVLILSIYLTANGENISRWLRRETPGSQRRHTALLINIVNQVVGGYIRGTLTMALLIGTLVGGGLFLLHVRYALLLGILAFFMEFIPIMGVMVSGALSVGVALFQGWVLAVIVLAYFVFVHIIEGDIVGPRIMGKAVGIHPATALVALVAGTELFGIWGALFAAPVAGLVQAILTAAYKEMRGGDPTVVLHAVEAKADETVASVPPTVTPEEPVPTNRE